MEKMSFDEFKEMVSKEVPEMLPEGYDKPEFQLVTKNNGEMLTGMFIKKDNRNIAPVIYLEPYYEDYKDGVGMGTILRRIADSRTKHNIDQCFDEREVTDYAINKNRIMPSLIGTEHNECLLNLRPHVEVGDDLAVVFRIDLANFDGENLSIPVTHQIRTRWGVSIAELYDQALENQEKAGDGVFVSMKMMMLGLAKEFSSDEETARRMEEDITSFDNNMYILTNRQKLNGASMLLSQTMMDKVMEKLGERFYILPSSIHETIIMPATKDMKVEDLEQMVREVNASSVLPEDVLSNHVYRYTKESGLVRAIA